MLRPVRPVRLRMVGGYFHARLPIPGSRHIGGAVPGPRVSRYANHRKVGACQCGGLTRDRAGAVDACGRDLAGEPDLIEAARHGLGATTTLVCW